MTEWVGISEIRERLKGKKIFVIPYMHADWAWCHTREWHARRYIAAFEDLVATLRKKIGYRWYMDCFCTEMGPLTERRPDLIEALRPYVKSGEVQIAGSFSNVRPNMVGDEAYVRNMIIGRRKFAEAFPGAEMLVQGESVDTAIGHSQMPQLLRKGGYRYLRAGRPYEVMEKKGLNREFFWESPDGSRVLVSWGDYHAMWIPQEVEELNRRFDDWDAFVEYVYNKYLKEYPRGTDADILWMAQGCDDTLPLKAFNRDIDVPGPEMIRKWNATEDSEICFAGPNDFFRELERQADRFRVHRGAVDIADVCYNVCWGAEKGLISKRLHSSECLCASETWQLLAQLCGDSPAQDLTPQWEDCLTASAHATAWLFTQDFEALSEGIEKAILDADCLKKKSLKALAGRIRKCEGAERMVFNGLSWDRDAVIRLTVPFTQTEGVSFVDGDGNELPWQIVRTYEFTDQVWEHDVLVRVRVPALGYTQVCIRGANTDCRYGGKYTPVEKPQPFDASASFSVDNGTLRLDFENGRAVRIYDHEAGRFQPGDGESAWNDLVFSRIDTLKDALHAGPVEEEFCVAFTRATILESGPVRWLARLEGSDGRVNYVQEIALTAGSRDIQMKVSFRWPASEGRLCCRIPTTTDCVLRGGIPFGSEVKDVDGEPYANGTWTDMHRLGKGLFCAKDYVRACTGDASAALIGQQCDRYYHFDRERCALSYVLLNSTKLYENTWEDHINRVMYSLGEHEIRYGLRIGAAGENDRRAEQAARELRMPVDLTAPYVRPGEAALPPSGSFLKLHPENVLMTAMYRDGGETVLRLYETDGVSADVSAVLPAAAKCVVSTDFIGNPDGREIRLDGEKISFPIGPCEIVTLRILF